MKIVRRHLLKDSSSCFVVTRNGRRVEDKNYQTKYEAENRADILNEMVKEWDPASVGKIEIVHTSLPSKVY